MKHLIALSLKYMRRRKLRTTLTAICIVLSVFILNLFAVAGSSLLASLKQEEMHCEGAWEWNVTDMIYSASDSLSVREEKKTLIKNHPAVSEYHFSEFASYWTLTDRSPMDDAIGFLEIQLNDTQPLREHSLEVAAAEGNCNLLGTSNERIHGNPNAAALQKGEVLLPEWGKAQGYAVGDTVTLRITPVYAILDDTVPQVAQMRKQLAENNADEEKDYMLIVDGTDKGKVDTSALTRRVAEYSMLGILSHFGYEPEELEFQQQRRGDTVELTVTVAGFFNSGNTAALSSIMLSREDFGFTYALADACRAMQTEDDIYAVFDFAEAPLYLTCITDSVPLLDGMQMVIDTFNTKNADASAEYIIDTNTIHEALLTLDLRYINFESNILVIAASVALVLLIIWGFARFVIDNAFEISVSERTRQFATLRIMGATKKQLLAVVFTEATAYTLFALPLGIAAAVGTTLLGVQVLSGTGIEHAEFTVYGWLLALTIVLSLLAIYISAYTSAMYAGRKLSLRQATHLHLPHKKKRACKLPKTERGFLYRYAWKNILRTQPRLNISTIAMTLGVTLSVALAELLIAGIFQCIDTLDESGYDFHIHGEGTAVYTPLMDYFEDNTDYRSFTMNTGAPLFIKKEENPVLTKDGQTMLSMCMIDETRYNRQLQQITGISYQAWLESDTVFLEYGIRRLGFDRIDGDVADPTGEKMKTQYQGATYESVSSVFGDAEPLIYQNNDIDISYSTVLEKPLTVTGCIFAPEDALQIQTFEYPNGMVQTIRPEYSLLIPIERYYQYFPKSSIVVTAIASRNADYRTLAAQLDTLCNQGYRIEYADNYYSYTGFARQLFGVCAVLAIIVISVWLAGVLTMVNTLHTNVLNRRTELRMLRTVGCSIKQIKKMLVTEGLLFSAVSTLLGCVLGRLFVSRLGGFGDIVTLNTMFGDELTVTFSLLIVIAMFGINLAVANLCAKPGMKHLMERTEDS